MISSKNPAPEEVHQGPGYLFENYDPPEELQYVWHLLGVDKDQQQKEAATFLLKLKVCNVSERTVGEVIAGYVARNTRPSHSWNSENVS